MGNACEYSPCHDLLDVVLKTLKSFHLKEGENKN